MDFKPHPKSKVPMPTTPLSMPAEMALALARKARSVGITKQELIRQMITHCLKEMKQSGG